LRINGTDFVSIAEDIDTTTPMGKAMFTIISVFAQLERELNMGRVRDVRQHRFEQGMFPARSHFGYKTIIKDKKVVGFSIDKKKAEIVSDCFLMASNGASYKEVCKKYKGKILQYRKGKKYMADLKPQQFYNITKNKVYCGYVLFEGNYVKGSHPPIISEELYNKCQKGG